MTKLGIDLPLDFGEEKGFLSLALELYKIPLCPSSHFPSWDQEAQSTWAFPAGSRPHSRYLGPQNLLSGQPWLPSQALWAASAVCLEYRPQYSVRTPRPVGVDIFWGNIFLGWGGHTEVQSLLHCGIERKETRKGIGEGSFPKEHENSQFGPAFQVVMEKVYLSRQGNTIPFNSLLVCFITKYMAVICRFSSVYSPQAL